MDLGAQVASDLLHSHEVTSRLSLKEVSSAQATAQMNTNEAFAAIVIPPNFTASLLSAYGLASASAGRADGAAGAPTRGREAPGYSWPAESPCRPSIRCRWQSGATCRRRPPSSAVPPRVESVSPIPLRWRRVRSVRSP